MNISFITSNDFRRLCPLVFECQHLNTSISVFLFLSKVSVLVHFQGSMRRLFPKQTFMSLVIYFFLLSDPNKKPKPNRSKTKRHRTRSQEGSPTNRRSANETLFGTLSQGLCADCLVCIACCIFWHLIGSDQLSYFP